MGVIPFLRVAVNTYPIDPPPGKDGTSAFVHPKSYLDKLTKFAIGSVRHATDHSPSPHASSALVIPPIP